MDIVQRLVGAGSVGPCDIGVITPYDAQTNLIKGWLRRSHTTCNVEVAKIDAFQGREHEVSVLSLTRCNRDGRLGHVDDGRRLNVALTRAKRGLVVIGNTDTLLHGSDSGLGSFIRDIYHRGFVIDLVSDPRAASVVLSGVPEQVVMDPDKARSTALSVGTR